MEASWTTVRRLSGRGQPLARAAERPYNRRMAVATKYETVIGIEVHAQLRTESNTGRAHTLIPWHRLMAVVLKQPPKVEAAG